MTGPRGWNPESIERRYVDSTASAPISYDSASRSVSAILSLGTPVKRFYGTEVLQIDQASINLDRVRSGNCPLLDSHSQSGISAVLGRVGATWISDGALWGKLIFGATRQGKIAEGMVSRGELGSVSCGYRVEEWEISDADGNVVDENQQFSWDDADDLTYTATRWELLEISTIGAAAPVVMRGLGVFARSNSVRY
jgi:hypothetical protein